MPGARADNQVEIWATGIMVPEALKASESLVLDGVYASVFNCTSPDRAYRRWQEAASRRRAAGLAGAPLVSVIDGHPSALAWVGSMLGARCVPLGVSAYGQSGVPAELYREFGIDSDAIAAAAFAALDAARS